MATSDGPFGLPGWAIGGTVPPYGSTTGSATGDLHISTSRHYDVRNQQHLVSMDMAMRREMMDRFERDFMAKMEERIWNRVKDIKTLQDKYDEILGSGEIKTGPKFRGVPMEYNEKMRKKMREAKEKMVCEPPVKKVGSFLGVPIKYNDCMEEMDTIEMTCKQPVRAGVLVCFDEHVVYNEKKTPVQNLWDETDEWLKSINLGQP
jgi:hypothetical protein